MYAPPIHVPQDHPQLYIQIPQAQHVSHNGHPPPQPQPHRVAPPPAPKEPITVVGVPSVSVQGDRLVVGDSQSSSARSYTPLKVLGDGSFGTVWLCDWHGTLPPNTPLSPMQCGAGAKPEWAGKRLVAVKRMKKSGGGWDECKNNKELESLRSIPRHPNIIPLYDFFLLPSSKELYFVFESMEGNLYHLIKTRKGRPLAGGLVSSIFHQIVSGLHHIHSSGYFHRDMKPENVLVTTIGLHDYIPVSPVAPPNAPPEKDVVAIIKLADFGLARETNSKPPYTEYVSTRWYRAPEVLLLSREYSNPVDMWALGTIMAELVNLRPLFPGSGHIDQVARICEVLGYPSDKYGLDSHGGRLGGGKWIKGIKLAKERGFVFPEIHPRDIYTFFEPSVPVSLIQCINDLLKYDPDVRLTSRQCLEHAYLLETIPRNNIPLPSGIQISTSPPFSRSQPRNEVPSSATKPSMPAHAAIHSNGHAAKAHYSPQSHLPSDASAPHRTPFYPSSLASQSPSSYKSLDPSQDARMYEPATHVIIQEEQRSQPSSTWGASASHPSPAPNGDFLMDTSPIAEQSNTHSSTQADSGHSQGKLGKLGFGFGKKHPKWGLNVFGNGDKAHQNPLPPVIEIPVSRSTPSLKRTQSSGSDRRSLHDASSVEQKKFNKKEAERLQRDAEKQRRALAEKTQREQARAVMNKRKQMIMHTNSNTQLEWRWQNSPGSIASDNSKRNGKGKIAASGPIRQNQAASTSSQSPTIAAAAGRFVPQSQADGERTSDGDWRRDSERVAKARRREFDDDHSMSSSDMTSMGRMSQISFATVDSDPGPSRMRTRPSLFGINRMTSTSSLRTSFDDFPTSARSSNSLSLEGQLANDFRVRANLDSISHFSGSVSPPPMQSLSLSPSPPWIQAPQPKSGVRDQLPYLSIPQPAHPANTDPPGPTSPYDYGVQVNGYRPTSYGHPPSPGFLKSEINPIFKVPPLPLEDRIPSATLPPFSQLEAVADGEYPPLSPMSFNSPDEDA